eukprot:scaffold329717_cov61-Tisochrysis_lutea.AAC.1
MVDAEALGVVVPPAACAPHPLRGLRAALLLVPMRLRCLVLRCLWTPDAHAAVPRLPHGFGHARDQVPGAVEGKRNELLVSIGATLPLHSA